MVHLQELTIIGTPAMKAIQNAWIPSAPLAPRRRVGKALSEMNAEIVPLAEEHFEELRRALDVVAREKRYLAFQAAPSPEDAYSFYRDILSNDYPHFVAVINDVVSGWCDVLPVRGESRAHVGILGIALVPSARGRGLGAGLMQAAIAKAWGKGLSRIELTVRCDNANARALYERQGFNVEGVNRRAFCVEGKFHDSYSLGRLC